MRTTLTQSEADSLIAMDKEIDSDLTFSYPAPGSPSLVIPFVSVDGQEDFLIDLTRGRIKMSKVTHQLRGRNVIVLVRVDLDGPPHQNPDGVIIPCPHIHVYREGFADKWAEALPSASFSNPLDRWTTLQEFLRYATYKTSTQSVRDYSHDRRN